MKIKEAKVMQSYSIGKNYYSLNCYPGYCVQVLCYSYHNGQVVDEWNRIICKWTVKKWKYKPV